MLLEQVASSMAQTEMPWALEEITDSTSWTRNSQITLEQLIVEKKKKEEAIKE